MIKHNFSFLSGNNPLVVSLFTEETKNNVDNFRLRARPPGDLRRSILCEKVQILNDNNYTFLTQESLLTVITG